MDALLQISSCPGGTGKTGDGGEAISRQTDTPDCADYVTHGQSLYGLVEVSVGEHVLFHSGQK